MTATCKLESFTEKATLLFSGNLDLPDVQPGQKQTTRLPESISKLRSDKETWLTISLRLRTANIWSEQGHEVAWAQQRFAKASTLPDLPQAFAGGNKLHLRTSRTSHTISAGSFEIVFDRARGQIQSWTSEGQALLVPDSSTNSALIPGFWRAPIDNDRSRDESYWKRFGLHILTSQLRSISLKRVASDEVHITSVSFLSPPVLDWGLEVVATYCITATQTVAVHIKLRPTGKIPDTLPRIGLDIRLSKRLNRAHYLGLGPGESYPDKMAAQKMGAYTSDIKDLYTSYDVPQESGNRMGARRVTVFNDSGLGLLATRLDEGTSFAWSAGYHTPQTLDKTKHPCNLVEEDVLLLRLDVATAGVGSGACGPGLTEDVQVKCQDTNFSFQLQKVLGR